MEAKLSKAEVYEYKGHPVISIPLPSYVDKEGVEKTQNFSFGIKKARAILEHIEEIREFAIAPELTDQVDAVDAQTDNDELPF